MRGHYWRAATGGAALAGTLDLASIFVLLAPRGIGAERILQSVASGLFGPAAFTGGAVTAAWGFAAHYAIMLIFAAGFLFATRRIALVRARPYAMGALYGLGSFFVMNYLVVPLSAAARWPHWTPLMLGHALVVHIVFVGLVLAWFTEPVRQASPQ
jgi:hypothetical protein